MTVQEMADKMLDKIDQFDHVSFVELEKAIGPEALGNTRFFLPGYSKVVLWEGVSEKFVEAFEIVRKKRKAYRTSFLTYLADGKWIALPVVKRLIKNFKNEHWMPLTLRRDPSVPLKPLKEVFKGMY